MKTVEKILITLAGLYLVAVPVCLSGRVNQIRCTDIVINISDSSENKLITRREVESLMRREGRKLPGAELKDIDLQEIEERIRTRREVKTAEAYVTIDGNLRVSVRQREPVMRLITGSGDWFIDEEGVLFSKRKLYTPRLHIVSGSLDLTRPVLEGVSVLDTAAGKTKLKDLFNLVSFIRHDSFWAAQIDQIRVSDNGDISLIPRTAGHVVIIGSVNNLGEKLENLRTFYDRIMPLSGWDAYSLIDLRFNGQIVCRKKPK